MRPSRIALPIILGLLSAASPALADSVSVTSGPNGTTIVNGKPCRVVTRDDNDSRSVTGNSTSITAGNGSVSGTTSISPGGSGTSVTVGSGSSSNGTTSSSSAGSDCVIYKNKNEK
jgi:hypothetical protein